MRCLVSVVQDRHETLCAADQHVELKRYFVDVYRGMLRGEHRRYFSGNGVLGVRQKALVLRTNALSWLSRLSGRHLHPRKITPILGSGGILQEAVADSQSDTTASR